MIRGAALKDTGHPKMTNVSFNHHVVLDPYDFLLWDTKGSFVKNFLFFPSSPVSKVSICMTLLTFGHKEPMAL